MVMVYFQCCRIVIACAVLYNLRKRMGMPEVELEEDDDDGEEDEVPQNDDNQRIRDAPMARRQYYVDQYFTNL